MENPTVIATEYINIIKKFKNRFDVQNGSALGYRDGQKIDGNLRIENKPKSIGEGLNTTGWCVSVSQALLYDKIFQLFLIKRQSKAKMVSIDIKEMFYGSCYNGSQNKWHTALLVSDSGVNFIIDLTCGQFGNNFVGKDIWDFETWEKTFRSPIDKHKINDWEENEITYVSNVVNDNKDMVHYHAKWLNSLASINTLTDIERKEVLDFLTDKISIINKKLITGNLINLDFKYMSKINKLLKEFNFVTKENQYYVMEFSNKDSAKNWIAKLLKNDEILANYLLVSDSLEKSCLNFNINPNDVNIESIIDKTFIVLNFTKCAGPDISFIDNLNVCIPAGIKLTIDLDKGIYNGGKKLSDDVYQIERKTNTIFIDCKI